MTRPLHSGSVPGLSVSYVYDNCWTLPQPPVPGIFPKPRPFNVFHPLSEICYLIKLPKFFNHLK